MKKLLCLVAACLISVFLVACNQTQFEQQGLFTKTSDSAKLSEITTTDATQNKQNTNASQETIDTNAQETIDTNAQETTEAPDEPDGPNYRLVKVVATGELATNYGSSLDVLSLGLPSKGFSLWDWKAGEGSLTYDELGRLQSVKWDGNYSAQEEYDYDVDGRMLSCRYTSNNMVNTLLERYWSYDDNGLLLRYEDKSTWPDIPNRFLDKYETNEYDTDESGRKHTIETQEQYNGTKGKNEYYAVDKKETVTTTDAEGRVSIEEVYNLETSRYTYSFDSNNQKVTDEAVVYDTPSLTSTTYYTYDENGNIIKKIEDSGGLYIERISNYNEIGKLISRAKNTYYSDTRALIESEETNYSYDEFGNKTEELRITNDKYREEKMSTFWQYDSEGKLVRIAVEYWDNGYSAWSEWYEYDEDGNMTADISKDEYGTVIEEKTYSYYSNGTKKEYQCISYDNGRETKATKYYYDECSGPGKIATAGPVENAKCGSTEKATTRILSYPLY